MGLSVVHGIVHDNQGHILINTSPGKGTTFSILLPEYTGEKEAIESKPDRTTNYNTLSGKGRIMVIDDDPALANYNKDFLTARGYDIATFTDPCEALNEFNENPEQYDMVNYRSNNASNART